MRRMGYLVIRVSKLGPLAVYPYGAVFWSLDIEQHDLADALEHIDIDGRFRDEPHAFVIAATPID